MSTTSNVIKIEYSGSDAATSCVAWSIQQSNVSVVSDFVHPSVPKNAVDLDAFLDEFLNSPDIAENVPKARAELSQQLQNRDRASLRTLRLAKGMSQSQLAQAISSSQSRVSRLEALQEEASVSVLRKLASALSVDFNTLMDALYRADK